MQRILSFSQMVLYLFVRSGDAGDSKTCLFRIFKKDTLTCLLIHKSINPTLEENKNKQKNTNKKE